MPKKAQFQNVVYSQLFLLVILVFCLLSTGVKFWIFMFFLRLLKIVQTFLLLLFVFIIKITDYCVSSFSYKNLTNLVKRFTWFFFWLFLLENKPTGFFAEAYFRFSVWVCVSSKYEQGAYSHKCEFLSVCVQRRSFARFSVCVSLWILLYFLLSYSIFYCFYLFSLCLSTVRFFTVLKFSVWFKNYI